MLGQAAAMSDFLFISANVMPIIAKGTVKTPVQFSFDLMKRCKKLAATTQEDTTKTSYGIPIGD